MFIFRHGGRRAVAQCRPSRLPIGKYRAASRLNIPIPRDPNSLPVIEHCPAPTCQCQEMPADLDIEREQNISSSMPSYAEQVLISTGRSDWKSRIEEEEEEGVLVRQLKGFLGPKGKYSDPYHNVMLTNSSLSPTKPPTIQDAFQRSHPASAFLFPSFQYVPSIPTDSAGVEDFVRAFLLPSRLHQSHDRLTRAEKNILLRQPEMQRRFVGARKVDEILVLICGHSARDVRCGTLGPILQREFEEKLQRQNVPLLRKPPVAEADEMNANVEGYTPAARVGLISHIGGHKWAGNVIVYIPPSFTANGLAGKGIWYGRVAPANVEGIVQKTIIDGKIIGELFRGGIDQNRDIIRL